MAAAATDAEKTSARAAVREEYLAAMLLSGANYIHFEKLRENLSNHDIYPKMVIACLSMLDRYNIKHVPKPHAQGQKADGDKAVVFAQSATTPQSK